VTVNLTIRIPARLKIALKNRAKDLTKQLGYPVSLSDYVRKELEKPWLENTKEKICRK
jgi:hypothetical protein